MEILELVLISHVVCALVQVLWRQATRTHNAVLSIPEIKTLFANVISDILVNYRIYSIICYSDDFVNFLFALKDRNVKDVPKITSVIRK